MYSVDGCLALFLAGRAGLKVLRIRRLGVRQMWLLRLVQGQLFALVIASTALLYVQEASAQFSPPAWRLVPSPSSGFSAQQDTSLDRPAMQLASAALKLAQAQKSSADVTDPIPPLTAIRRLWPSPSLNPGVPSAYIANWGDVFVGVSAATAGNLRPNADGSWGAGFGLGNAERAVALEVSGGCGSFKQFCANGGLGFRVSRVLMKTPTSLLALAGGWQNTVQWGNEGRQDNIYYGTLSYSFPLRSIQSNFPQTLQINAGVGNSSFAPFDPINSEDNIGGFASIGVQLSPALGLSAGWSGRGANAQLSYTPFRDTPVTVNLLGADLFNQNPAGTVGVLSVTWGRTFLTPNFR